MASAVLKEYATNLPTIYRDILAAFPAVDPSRQAGYGLAFQTLMVALDHRYSLGQIRTAAERLAENGIAEIRNGIFIHPTGLGEEIIEALTGRPPAAADVPPLSPPPAYD